MYGFYCKIEALLMTVLFLITVSLTLMTRVLISLTLSGPLECKNIFCIALNLSCLLYFG